MREFYRSYEAVPKMLAEAMTIGWTQNMAILEAKLTLQERKWYIRAVKRFGWSKLTLLEEIKSGAHAEVSLDFRDEVCYTEEKNTETERTNDDPTRRKLAEHGIDCAGKTARQLKNRDYDQFDLLIGVVHR